MEYEVDFNASTGYYFTIAKVVPLNTLLPVELLSFEVKKTDSHQVNITWATSSELGLDYFEVERSQDGITWDDLTSINPLKGDDYPKIYTTKDRFPYTGLSYYRLKEINADGRSKELSIKTILIDQPKTEVKLYPNPTNRITYLEGDMEELSTVHIYNSSGDEVTQAIQKKQHNDVTLELDFKEVPSGTYVIKTKQNTKVLQKY